MKRIAVLICSHNRKETTLRCLCNLSRLDAQSFIVEIILVDDGSKDGTSQTVRDHFPRVKIIEGDGRLYWNGAMRRAFEYALRGNFDGYLWLNDDAHMRPNGLAVLVNTFTELRRLNGFDPIIVGSACDPETKCLTYGGLVSKSALKPLGFALVQPEAKPLQCDTMNGNCVLIPRSVAEQVGNLDSAFIHTMGDIDYGLRASGIGIKIYVAPGYVAECTANPGSGWYNDSTASIVNRMRHIVGPKGLPPRPWLKFVRRHGGPLWPFLFVRTYFKVLR